MPKKRKPKGFIKRWVKVNVVQDVRAQQNGYFIVELKIDKDYAEQEELQGQDLECLFEDLAEQAFYDLEEGPLARKPRKGKRKRSSDLYETTEEKNEKKFKRMAKKLIVSEPTPIRYEHRWTISYNQDNPSTYTIPNPHEVIAYQMEMQNRRRKKKLCSSTGI